MRVSVKAESVGVTAGRPRGSPAGPHRSPPLCGPVPSATPRPGPVRPGAFPPGCGRRPTLPPAPSSGRRRRPPRCPVPHAWVSPTPRSHTRRSMAVPPGSTEMNSTLIPPGCTSWSRLPTPATSTPAGSGPRRTRWGLPMSTWRARRSANCWGWSGPRTASPMSTAARAEPGVSPGTYSTVRIPARVDTVNTGGVTRPASTAAWARHRMPLPLISAPPPSALRRSMARSASPEAGWTRMTPSAPTPNLRSHRARTNSGSRDRESSTSTSTRKSLPAPWCLVRWSERGSGGG